MHAYIGFDDTDIPGPAIGPDKLARRYQPTWMSSSLKGPVWKSCRTARFWKKFRLLTAWRKET